MILIQYTKLFGFSFLSALLLATILVLILVHRIDPLIFEKFSKRRQSLRDQHTKPISRLGGIGISLAFFATILVIWKLPIDYLSVTLRAEIGIFLIGAGGAFLLGLMDDIFDLRARYKLLGQIVIAGGTAVLGTAIDFVQIPLIGSQIALGAWTVPVTMLWIVGVMNAVNLIDGLDGLASGVSIVAFLFLGWIGWENNNITVVLVCVIMIGSTAGFWVFNKHPASIFMGDSGSMLLGYVLGTLSIWAVENPNNQTISIVPILILGVPLMDTCFAFFRRYLKGVPFYSADRDHMHHRLLHKGLSTTQASLALASLGAIFGALGVGAHYSPEIAALLYMLFVLIIYFVLYFLEYDVIKKPFSVIRAKPELRKKRELLNAISENCDLYFGKENSLRDLFHSFTFWMELMRIDKCTVNKGNKCLYRTHSTTQKMAQKVTYDWGNYQVQFGFTEESYNMDSDVKSGYLEEVSHSLVEHIKRIETIEQQSFQVISTKNKNMSSTYSRSKHR